MYLHSQRHVEQIYHLLAWLETEFRATSLLDQRTPFQAHSPHYLLSKRSKERRIVKLNHKNSNTMDVVVDPELIFPLGFCSAQTVILLSDRSGCQRTPSNFRFLLLLLIVCNANNKATPRFTHIHGHRSPCKNWPRMLQASRAVSSSIRSFRTSKLRTHSNSTRNMSQKRSKTAAYLLIGDEVLSGTVQDTNGPFLAQYFRKRGIDLTRIEVIPDKVRLS